MPPILHGNFPWPMTHVTLRPWRDTDLAPFAALNADPEVMRFFPATLSRDQSDAFATRQQEFIETRGWGLWAVDVDNQFAGFTGLAVPTFEAPFTPCVEIGWRLARPYWGRGIAFRAATLALHHAFTVLQLPEIVTFTAALNTPSIRLMERLDFTRDADFLHPRLPEDHALRPHVLYRKKSG